MTITNHMGTVSTQTIGLTKKEIYTYYLYQLQLSEAFKLRRQQRTYNSNLNENNNIVFYLITFIIINKTFIDETWTIK